MPEDLPDHRRVLDARQHPNLPPALLAGLDLNPEDPLEPLGLRKRPVPLRRGPQVRRRGLQRMSNNNWRRGLWGASVSLFYPANLGIASAGISRGLFGWP